MNRLGKIAFALGATGLLLNLRLLFLKFQGGIDNAVGCGAGDCASILSSRWSEVLTIPLPSLGVAVYLILLAALVRKWRAIEWTVYGGVAGAAVWLVALQAGVLHRFCPWCMAAHVIGLGAVSIGIAAVPRDRRLVVHFLTGLLAAVGLALFQVFGPASKASAVASIPPSVPSAVDDIHARGSGRKITFDHGRKVYDLDALPHLGPPEAEHVLVEYFDFLCPACQRMQQHLDALVEAWPGKICVIVLPVPLEHGCNTALPENETGHPGSCVIARIALAVWRVDASIYPVIHRRFMAEPPLDAKEALAIARGLVDSDALATALEDAWIDEIIRTNIADWDRFAGKLKILPQLLLTAGRILHGIPPGRDEFFAVMEKELGRSPNHR